MFPSHSFLPLLTLTLALVGCDSKPEATKATTGRSNGVLAPSGVEAAPPTSNGSPSSSGPTVAKDASRHSRKGDLCAPTKVRGLPTDRISGQGTSSLPFAGGAIPSGSLTWVNLWAAWCEPCKKELPLLQKWKRDLAKKGVSLELVFVSIDDDQRQLTQFLERNPASLSSTYWLEEGPMRDAWLKKAEISADPRLPVHLLVNHGGDVFCQIDGAIEENDFAEVEKMLSAAR